MVDCIYIFVGGDFILFDRHKDRLVSLIQHAIRFSPFYANHYSGILLNELTKELFETLPILDKSDIRGKEDQLLTNPSTDDLLMEYTSGSTGLPMKCYKSVPVRSRKAIDMWNWRRKKGHVLPSDRCLLFSSSQQYHFDATTIAVNDNKLYLSILDMSPSSLDAYYEAMMDFKPDWIFSVPSALHIFAKHVLQRGYPIKGLPLRYIEVTGELLFDHQRNCIEQVFGKIICNMYGTREHWTLASSCMAENLHILERQYYVEIVNMDDTDTGEVVVTDLENLSWPLIRYRLGDLASVVKEPCSCGLSTQVIRVTGGRTQEYIRIGEWTGNPILIKYAVQKINLICPDYIQQYRVYQMKESFFVMEIVSYKIDEDIDQEIIYYLCKTLPLGTEVRISHVDYLPIEGNKFKYFIPFRG
jgi:phenylacetate-CoA ligase